MSTASWRDAHRVAIMATTHTRRDLRVAADQPRVDVCAAIRRAKVALMWRSMPTVFGAYINEAGSQPGILINANLSAAGRRYTAAHELGHHSLHHVTSVDDDSTIAIQDAVPGRGRTGWTNQEMQAEAFAAWFLMPRATVLNALQILGLSRPNSALDCYRLALLLGTPYRTTVRHLLNLKLASAGEVTSWGRVPPGRLKGQLDRGVQAPSHRNPDVWLLDQGLADLDLELQPGDRVILSTVSLSEVSAPTWLHGVGHTAADAAAGQGAVLEAVEHHPEQELLAINSSTTAWSVTVCCPYRPLGLEMEFA